MGIIEFLWNLLKVLCLIGAILLVVKALIKITIINPIEEKKQKKAFEDFLNTAFNTAIQEAIKRTEAEEKTKEAKKKTTKKTTKSKEN